jgi:predicted thioesterase
MTLEVGTTGRAELTVYGSDLATILNQRPEDDFPPVFATTRMIGLMELAGSRVLHPLLNEGEASVGVGVDVMHTAATSIGDKVEAEARFTGMEGKLYVFEVVERDSGGEIGRGIHKRAIVSVERLVTGASRRCAGAG